MNKQDNLTHSLTKLSPSWGATNCAATQELPSILWNSKVYYCVYKSPSLIPILSHINLIHTIPSYLRSILILPTHLGLGLHSGLFPSGFPTNKSVQVRCFLWSFATSIFLRWGVVSSTAKPKLEGQPLSTVQNCSFNIFAATLHLDCDIQAYETLLEALLEENK
jgi:hypothetical protein